MYYGVIAFFFLSLALSNLNDVHWSSKSLHLFKIEATFLFGMESEAFLMKCVTGDSDCNLESHHNANK